MYKELDDYELLYMIMDNDDNTISLMVGDGETSVNQLPDLLKIKNPNLQKAQVDKDTLIL